MPVLTWFKMQARCALQRSWGRGRMQACRDMWEAHSSSQRKAFPPASLASGFSESGSMPWLVTPTT